MPLTMTFSPPTLHLFCGKVASGKSTLAGQIAQQEKVVLLSEDEWLHSLYADELNSLHDYARYTQRIRTALQSHLITLLKADLSVALDFQANTLEARAWMRTIIDETRAEHQLHIMNTPDVVCLSRLKRRDASGRHPFSVSEAQFHQITSYFQPPSKEEGFHLIRHDGSSRNHSLFLSSASNL